MRITERYEKLNGLAVGSMGEVWRGRDTRLNREVAVKLIRGGRQAADDETRRRFFREARILGRLRHPGIPALYDFGATDDGDLFQVMELIDGAALTDLISEVVPGPVPWAADIGAQLCAALSAAHGAALVHRDLKPANVVLCRNGAVKVLDFGVAAVLEGSEFSDITLSGEAPGTAFYMAPELADGGEPGPRSDLYALGCLLHELLTGTRVFASDDPLTEIDRHLTERPTPVRRVRQEVPVPFERLLLTLLAKTPDDRPRDATEVFTNLLPLALDLPPLPGFVNDSPYDPVLMYATALVRKRIGPDD